MPLPVSSLKYVRVFYVSTVITVLAVVTICLMAWGFAVECKCFGNWCISCEYGGLVVTQFPNTSPFSFSAGLNREAIWQSTIGWESYAISPNLMRRAGPYSDTSIPLWLLLLGATITANWARWRSKRWSTQNHCPCGYDLTGNQSGVCPECGTAVNLNRDCTNKAV